jgi:LacI family transcriptional regulator
MGEAAVAAWLEGQRRPLAVFACNDTCAQQVLNACRERGVRVPEEVAVLGVDNDDVLCNLCDPPLSSIDPNADELGYRAAALLDRLMCGDRAESDRFVIRPARLVERASTDTVAIGDPITAKAARFIRDHVGEGIAPKDVLRYAGRSRSDLEQRFRRWLKHGVHAEILRRRLDRASVLLQRSDLDLSAVAQRAGCSSATHLCRLFRRQFGCTPTEFRLAQSKRPA